MAIAAAYDRFCTTRISLPTAPSEGRGEIYFKQAFGDWYWLADNIAAFFEPLRDRA